MTMVYCAPFAGVYAYLYGFFAMGLALHKRSGNRRALCDTAPEKMGPT